MGGDVENFRPFPQPGQWWALRNPTALARVTSPVLALDNTIMLELWHPGGREEVVYIPPLPEALEFLWFERDYPLIEGIQAFAQWWRPAEVRLVPNKGKLFFVGFPTRSRSVRIHASWFVDLSDMERSKPYQVGIPKTENGVWDKILEESVI